MSWPREGSRETDEGIIVPVPCDWCRSPTAIIPYKIWARQKEAANLANTVRQTSNRTHVKGSLILKCHGDEPGVGGGVKSGTHGAECTPKTWSESVRAEGRNIVRHDDEWWMNNKNTWGRLNYTKDMSRYSTAPTRTIVPRMGPVPKDAEKFVAQQAGSGALASPASGGTAATIPSPADVAGSVGSAMATPEALGVAGGAAYGGLIGGTALIGVMRGQATVDDAERAAAGLPPANRTLLGAPLPDSMPVPQPSTASPTAPKDGYGMTPPPPSADQIDKSESNSHNRATALSDAKVKPTSWVRVSRNKCAKYACGIPGSRYRGGTWLCTKGGTTQSHHTPAASVSYLPYSAGPTIQMDPMDHYQTLSYGGGLASGTYRASQAGLISSGNFLGAVGMDVADVRSHFKSKYDGALAQMLVYANCLKQNGFVR